MKFSNNEIYSIATDLVNNMNNLETYIPAKANFFLQKNMKTLISAAEDINKSRIEIIKHYGTLEETEGQYTIPQENLEVTNKELIDLFSIEQDLDIKTFKIEDLGNAEFTSVQMQAIMFMIED